MGTWLLIALFGTIAVTAGLVAILQRVNGQGPRRRNDSGDSGSHVYADGGSRRDSDSPDSSDGGSDGGGDGGGGD